MRNSDQQKILIITRNLPPLVGGMERLNWHMADELSKHAEVKVIGPKGSASIKPQQVCVHETSLKPLPLFFLIAFCKALWLSIRWKPDVILAGSGLTTPLALLASRLCGAKSAAYLHGFDITVKNKFYQYLWVPAFKKIDTIIVNSSPTKRLACTAGIHETKITIIYPGVSLPDAPQPAENIAAFKSQHQLTDKKILLSVGRLTTRKGLREFVELALPSIVQTVPNAMLVVIGEAPKDSLGANIQTMESILSQAEQSGVAGHIKFLGVITDKVQLATAYEAADVHVFPVRYIANDPEGFGMVAIEAAAHGLPTVAFASGGVIDAVSAEKSGYLAMQGDYSTLTHYVLQILSGSPDSWRQGTVAFASDFSWPVFGSQIISVLCGKLASQHSNNSQIAD